MTQHESTPEWEVEARARLAAAVQKFSGPLTELIERDANEGDTRMLVADLLSDGLNYSKYDALTTEYRTKGASVDYGILIDGQPFALVEVKHCGENLDARHMRQAKSHAVNEGVAWVVLTNGRDWQLHHVGAENNTTELIFDVDLLAEADAEGTLDALFHLSREAVDHGRLENLRRWRAALAPTPLAEVLQSGPVVDAVRAEVRKHTGHIGHIGDSDEIARVLRDDVIARRLLE